jgi:hypothetical protein
MLAILHQRDHGGQRHHPGRQKVRAEQRIDDGALAALELPGHHEIESVAIEFPGQLRAGFLIHALQRARLRQAGAQFRQFEAGIEIVHQSFSTPESRRARRRRQGLFAPVGA